MRDVFFEEVSKILDRYTIQFKGLTTGQHIINFDVENDFFSEFENSDVSGGNLEVEIVLEKHTNMMELDIFIEGDVEVKCDRCLESFKIPTEFEGKLVVRISDSIEEGELDDEIWFVNSNDYELPLAQYIYESICLSLPIQRYHGILGTSEDDCDKEMLNQLEKFSHHEDTPKGKTDSRWDKLKDLMSN